MSELPGSYRQGPTGWTGTERLVHCRQVGDSLGPFLFLILSLIRIYLLKGVCWAQVLQRGAGGPTGGSRDNEQMNKKMLNVYKV